MAYSLNFRQKVLAVKEQHCLTFFRASQNIIPLTHQSFIMEIVNQGFRKLLPYPLTLSVYKTTIRITLTAYMSNFIGYVVTSV